MSESSEVKAKNTALTTQPWSLTSCRHGARQIGVMGNKNNLCKRHNI